MPSMMRIGECAISVLHSSTIERLREDLLNYKGLVVVECKMEYDAILRLTNGSAMSHMHVDCLHTPLPYR